MGVVTAADKCTCEWSTGEDHDRLATIEDMDPIDALRLVAEVLLNEGGASMTLEPDQLLDFAAQHNWRDPARVGWAFRVLHTVGKRAEVSVQPVPLARPA